MPNKIYKMMPLDDIRVESIENSQIWFTKASSFNDPFDCAIEPHLSKDVPEAELRKKLLSLCALVPIFDGVIYPDYYSDSISDRNSEAYKIVCRRINEIGVSSFLSSPFNILNWSHYARSHTGVCLEYCYEYGPNGFDRTKNGFSIHEVSYTNKFPFCHWHEFLSAPEFSIEILLNTKFTDWSYENELRIVSRKVVGDTLVNLSDLQFKLNAVYVGLSTDKTGSLYKRLEAHCLKNGIDVYEMTKDKYRFRLRKNS